MLVLYLICNIVINRGFPVRKNNTDEKDIGKISFISHNSLRACDVLYPELGAD